MFHNFVVFFFSAFSVSFAIPQKIYFKQEEKIHNDIKTVYKYMPVSLQWPEKYLVHCCSTTERLILNTLGSEASGWFRYW